MSITNLINSDPELKKSLEVLQVVNQEQYGTEDVVEDQPMSITIKPEALDTSNLSEGEDKNQYRPTELKDYVGQQEAKDQIVSYMKGCKKHNETFPHTFLSAPAGHGKTLLGNIIANMLGKKFVTCTGGELKSEQQFVDKVVECDGGVILIDEANRLNKKVGFFMLPLIEQFEIHNKKLKHFTVIFATTHKGDLSKDLDALIQRCDVELELNHYNKSELITIIKQYKDKQYPNEKISDEIYNKVAENCRFVPRMARRLLREYIFIRDWDQVLKNNKIREEGLFHRDFEILKYLNKFESGLGKNTISNFLRVKPATYEHEIEPYLVYKGLIIVSSRRKITDKGKELIKCI